MRRNAHRLKPVPPAPSTVFPMQTACRLESAPVCCLAWENESVFQTGHYTDRNHGSGELHALQGDGMEAGAARGWRGGPRGGGVRLWNGAPRVAGDGACADSQALRALRF